MIPFFDKYRITISFVLLMVLYSVGLALIVNNPESGVVALSSANLLISAVVLFWNHRSWNVETTTFLLIAFVVGMAAEIVGVNTGIPFGEYSYGNNLGPKVFEVPLIIGINWVMLSYATGVLVHRFDLPAFTKAVLAAGVMMGIDVLIEPVAPVLDYWSFDDGTAPVENFLSWFGVAFIIQLFFAFMRFSKTNKMALPLLWIQIVFFTILYFTIL